MRIESGWGEQGSFRLVLMEGFSEEVTVALT